MLKSSADYIRENDFEGAKERFDLSNGRWKQHWFNTCVIIAEKVKEWAKKYIFDSVNLTIRNINEKIKRVVKNKVTSSYVYLIKMFDDNNNYVFLKVGKAVDLLRRLCELNSQYYSRDDVQITDTKLIKFWVLPNSHLAEAFEQIIHSYLSDLFINIPNDRYEPVELTEEHFAEIERRYEMMSMFFPKKVLTN